MRVSGSSSWPVIVAGSVAVIVVVILVYIGLVAADWNRIAGAADMAPGLAHACGTDRLGRSVFDKLLQSTPATLGVAGLGAVIATALGTLVGAIAGLGRGWLDEMIVWSYSTLGSIPGILLMIGLSLTFSAMPGIASAGHGCIATGLALGLTGWIGTARLLRGEIRHRRAAPHVEAARALGLGPMRIWWHHILPATAHLVIIEGAAHFAGFIHAGVILSFLGAGPVEVLSWGILIDEGRTDLARGVWWQLVAATLAVLVVAIAIHILADALRDRLDPTIADGAAIRRQRKK